MPMSTSKSGLAGTLFPAEPPSIHAPSHALCDEPQTHLVQIFRTWGKGLGVRSTAPIKKGTLLVSEKPLLTAPNAVSLNRKSQEQTFDAILSKLSGDVKAKALRLHNAFPELVGLLGILKTNCVPIRNGERWGLFEIVSRFNHSCSPNVQYSWDEINGREVVYATVDIPKGVELCASYFHPTSPFSDRQTHIKNTFRFICICKTCTLDPDSLSKSDSRREHLCQIRNTVRSVVKHDPAQGLSQLQIAVDLAVAEGLSYLLQDLYFAGFEICIGCGDKDGAMSWGANAVEAKAAVLGKARAEDLKRLALAPEAHPSWGILENKTL